MITTAGLFTLLGTLSSVTAFVDLVESSTPSCGSAEFPFEKADGTMGTGADALSFHILSNTATGEKVEIIWQLGGKTERALLRSPTTGLLRDVLQTHEGNATAVRANSHWAGAQLLPFANRIANGTYDFFGHTYHLPNNEVTPGVRSDALHGFLFNRSLETRGISCSNESGVPAIHLTLGYRFEADDTTPGWPFKLDVAITYSLSAGALTITTRATSLEASHAVPWFNSWHPYFAVGDVSQARVEFDKCTPDWHASAPAQWSHITMGPGAPKLGDLIPTGAATPWTAFDGETPLGGTETVPTYMDDEFKSLLPNSASVIAACGLWYKQRIHDQGGDKATLVLFADRQHPVFQIYTGARETWGWKAIALEPMSALADAYNNGDGLTVLWPGEVFEGAFGLGIE